MRQLAGGQDGQVRTLPGMHGFSSLQLYPEDSVQRGTEKKRRILQQRHQRRIVDHGSVLLLAQYCGLHAVVQHLGRGAAACFKRHDVTTQYRFQLLVRTEMYS